MNLSTQLLENIVRAHAAGHSNGGETPVVDRRTEPRATLKANTLMVSIERRRHPEAPIEATIRDISAKGVGLTSSMSVPVGQQIAIRVTVPGGNPVWLACMVVRCRLFCERLWVIGAVFERVIDLKAASAKPPVAIGDECVEHARKALAV